MISKGHKTMLRTLKRAFRNDDVALMECTTKDTGEKIVVLCAVETNRDPGGKTEYEFKPFAQLFNGNPYETLVPPT